MKSIRETLAGYKFAPNSKVAKGLKNPKTSDKDLVEAAKTTKAWGQGLSEEIASIEVKETPAPEAPKSTTGRGGERR